MPLIDPLIYYKVRIAYLFYRDHGPKKGYKCQTCRVARAESVLPETGCQRQESASLCTGHASVSSPPARPQPVHSIGHRIETFIWVSTSDFRSIKWNVMIEWRLKTFCGYRANRNPGFSLFGVLLLLSIKKDTNFRYGAGNVAWWHLFTNTNKIRALFLSSRLYSAAECLPNYSP